MTEAELKADLAGELAWVRRLARAITRDATLADDLAQDAWAVADRAPADHRRKWFGRVLRNLFRMRRRSALRRARYETVADGRAVATPEELVARTEAQRAVSGAVLALAEPYRTTVVLRYVEDLSSAEIARRLGIPEGTVRRRLKVGVDRLRADLEKDQRTLALFVVPAARRTWAPAVLGALAIVMVMHLAKARRDQAEQVIAKPARGSVTPPSLPPSLAPPNTPAPVVPCETVTGQVRDASGPVAGARVATAASAVLTDETGQYSICIHPIRAVVRVEAPGYGAIEDARIHPTGDLAHDFELVPEAPITGRVVDAKGHAVANARVLARPERSERAAALAPGTATTSSDGTFQITGIAAGRFDVVARVGEREGHAIVDGAARTVELVLDHAATAIGTGTITGRVTRHGQPVAGAEVWCVKRQELATTATDGQFVLVTATGRCGLVAMARTATSEVVAVDLSANEHRTVDLDAVAAASIAGTVVDLRGAPVHDVYVMAYSENGDPAGDSSTDIHGAFVIDTLPAARYTLAAFPSPAFAIPFESSLQPLVVGDDAAVTGVEIAIDNQRVALHGRIVDAAGAPVADVFVAADHDAKGALPDAARSAADGSFTISNLVAGSYALHARAGDGRHAEQVDVVAGRDAVTLVLVR